jgi:hypothetical protein
MRTEMMYSILAFLISAILVKYFSLDQNSEEISSFKKIIVGIFGWIFFLSTLAWVLLFGDTFATWLISPEDDQLLTLIVSAGFFIGVYILSFRANAPYSGTEFLIFAIDSLNFQQEPLGASNMLSKFLRKRDFDKFIKEVQPDSQDHVMQQRENLVDHLSQQKTTMDGLKQLEHGQKVDIIDANKPFPTMLSRHPFFKYLKIMTIDPAGRKACLRLVYSQILEGVQLDSIARGPFLRQVYDFAQAIAHEPFLKQYTQFIDIYSISFNDSLSSDATKNTNEPLFIFEISTAVLQKTESTYINPLKLNTIATLRFRSDPVQPTSIGGKLAIQI